MDAELSAAISNYVIANGGTRVLVPDEAEFVRAQVARRFGFTDKQTWWWNYVPSPIKSVTYPDGDGLRRLAEILPLGEQRLFLFTTDDDPPPWLCVSGPRQAVLDLVAELRFFEFFIVDEKMTWIVFDTHHNTLIGHGNELSITGGDAQGVT